MKKVSKLVMMLLAGVLSVASLSSCNDDNDEPTPGPGELTEKEQEMKAIAEQFVSATVNETYKLLADYTDQLCNAMIDLREKVRDGSVQDADVRHFFSERLPISVSTRISTLGRLTFRVWRRH